MIKHTAVVAGALIMFAAEAFAQMEHGSAPPGPPAKAIAVLSPTKGSPVKGIVIFEVVKGGTKVTAHISGLTPGKHGFHVHEYGDCSSDDGMAAGGHYNPGQMPHSMPMSEKRHVGDMGNLEADKDGNAHLEYVDSMIALSGASSILGRGVIVHEKEDDLKTQPTGNAGGRLACGVVGLAK
ncbi:MAG TPA: superoxide dismutase family protein [Bacteroidota bacterium]|nr:superoxide dismutase family protein [Bacteroidota bacterium]